MSTHELVQTLGGTETSRSHANDEDVNVTSKRESARKLFMVIGRRGSLSKLAEAPGDGSTHMSAPMVGDFWAVVEFSTRWG